MPMAIGPPISASSTYGSMKRHNLPTGHPHDHLAGTGDVALAAVGGRALGGVLHEVAAREPAPRLDPHRLRHAVLERLQQLVGGAVEDGHAVLLVGEGAHDADQLVVAVARLADQRALLLQ